MLKKIEENQVEDDRGQKERGKEPQNRGGKTDSDQEQKYQIGNNRLMVGQKMVNSAFDRFENNLCVVWLGKEFNILRFS